MGERLKLGVNIDHVATLRQVRGVGYPSVMDAARVCEEAGASGITVHLREDRRHIQDADVYGLRKSIRTRLNLEMANSAEIVTIALDVLPDEVCLVPEKREELTTEGGLDAVRHEAALEATVERLSAAGIVVSLFIEPDAAQVAAAQRLGARCIELHTGTYCGSDGSARSRELTRLVAAARQAAAIGMQVNAGHGITLENIAGILEVPHLDTLNIGHSIVCDAVFAGLREAVARMLRGMAEYTGGMHG